MIKNSEDKKIENSQTVIRIAVVSLGSISYDLNANFGILNAK